MLCVIDAEAERSDPMSLSVSPMKCPNCGKTLPSNIRHCPYCGAAVRRRVPAWTRTLAILGFLGAMAVLVYYFILPSVELTKNNESTGITHGGEVTGISYFSVEAYDDKLYTKFSVMDSEGKAIKADGSGKVRIYDREKNKLFYERDFTFSSSDFKDFLLLGQPYSIMARERGWREFWACLFSIPREDGEGPDLKGRASLSIRTEDGRTFTREDPCIVVYTKQDVKWGEYRVAEDCLE